MLKIKDDVDLKELEKYGSKFYYDEYSGKIKEIWLVDDKYKYTSWWKRLMFKHIDIEKELFFRKKGDMYILVYPEINNFHNSMDLLYDLIKADLVEKVEKNK